MHTRGDGALSRFGSLKEPRRKEREHAQVDQAAKKPATRKAPEIAATKPGRFSGKKPFPSKAVAKSNPRRPTAKQRNGKEHTSFGYASLEIIRKKPGITYEEFIRAGGMPVDLRWDAERGRVEARA